MSQWIFLRGLAREARHWGDFPAVFARTAHTDKVTLLDLAGNGVFSNQRSNTSVRAAVEFARKQLAASGIGPPYQLMALSLGGMVACEWAALYPQDVSRMVLINTSMRPFSHAAQRLRPGNWLSLAALGLRWGDATFVEQTLFNLTCRRLDSSKLDQARWRQIRATSPVSLLNATRQLVAAARYRAPLLAPLCPVLVLSGGADRLVNPICSQLLASAWQVEHQQHSWAGHDLPHDDAQWLCQHISRWLQHKRLDAPL